MATSPPAERRIVVGVDGSAPSVGALRWAVGRAAATGAVVEAVICWSLPWVHGPTPASVDRELGSVARQMLADAVADAVGGRRHQVIRQIVDSGDPSEILPRRARGADLLVVGNHGRSGVAATLLGSVSRHCTEHATCTVVVVREPEEWGRTTAPERVAGVRGTAGARVSPVPRRGPVRGRGGRSEVRRRGCGPWSPRLRAA